MSGFGGFSTACGDCTFLLRTTEEEKLPKEEGRRLTFRRLKSKDIY
jgi:hypothetical protein